MPKDTLNPFKIPQIITKTNFKTSRMLKLFSRVTTRAENPFVLFISLKGVPKLLSLMFFASWQSHCIIYGWTPEGAFLKAVRSLCFLLLQSGWPFFSIRQYHLTSGLNFTEGRDLFGYLVAEKMKNENLSIFVVPVIFENSRLVLDHKHIQITRFLS